MLYSDWIMTAAVVLGPLMAVGISLAFEKRREIRQRKLHVFRTLMSTRKTPLSPDRISALNLVEVEFYKRTKVQSNLANLLRIYDDRAGWSNPEEGARRAMLSEVDDKSAKLIQAIGEDLGYKFDSLDLLRGGYFPEAFGDFEMQQEQIRKFFVGLSDGSKALRTEVLDVRHPEKILAQAIQTQSVINLAVRSSDPTKG